ncbi:hypothetical protein B0I35DRAFT_439882 [Stachybotrys elegans]|uniref:DUF7580 domain-containing protein n=1 Tax=Stachybotrys elegans TaxID=80388 RepID=A0A8K0SFS0_9HYPO|nr:hypothetical protein B0I35DRAFT_439882 [Stachybotrys elegans]
MSGLEVVGAVLGTIPLIISAVEHYERVIHTVHVLRRRAKVMHALARSLRTEQRILENTCETLLGGIVPADGIKPLLAEPFGPLWQDDKIRLEVDRRLNYTAGDFRDLVKDLMEALQELRIKLDLGSDMEVQKDESTVGKREVLKFVAIALTVTQHEDAVAKIADTNRKLETLLQGNLRNETFRTQTSKSSLFSLLQAVSWSIYNALRLSLACSCAPSHAINLGLPAPLVIKGQDVESVVRKLDFHLVFANEPQDSKGKGRSTWAWDEVLLRIADWPSKTTQPQPQSVPACPTPKTIKAKKSQGVRFMDDLPFVSNILSPSATLIQARTQRAYPLQTLTLKVGDQGKGALIRPDYVSEEPRQLSNLCDSFGKKPQSQTPRAFYGYITDGLANTSRRFGVYYLNSADDNDTFLAVSLRGLLERKLKPPLLSRRHCIAAVVAASILNLHGTPWMPFKLTSKDLYFIQRHGKVQYDQIFVTQTLADNISVASDISRDDSDNYDGNPSLHALGVLLMEIMLWKPIHDFWDDVNHKYSQIPAQVLLNIRSDKGFKRTLSVLERIGFSGGPAYRNAVEHCIKCDLQCDLESLDDKEFRDAVYHYVVAPLQNIAYITTAPMTAGSGRFACTA